MAGLDLPLRRPALIGAHSTWDASAREGSRFVVMSCNRSCVHAQLRFFHDRGWWPRRRSERRRHVLGRRAHRCVGGDRCIGRRREGLGDRRGRGQRMHSVGVVHQRSDDVRHGLRLDVADMPGHVPAGRPRQSVSSDLQEPRSHVPQRVRFDVHGMHAGGRLHGHERMHDRLPDVTRAPRGSAWKRSRAREEFA